MKWERLSFKRSLWLPSLVIAALVVGCDDEPQDTGPQAGAGGAGNQGGAAGAGNAGGAGGAGNEGGAGGEMTPDVGMGGDGGMGGAGGAPPNLCEPNPCTGDQVCDPTTGACLEPAMCDSDDDCLEGRICEAPSCVPGCGSDEECVGTAAGDFCNPDTNRCMTCFLDEHCPGLQLCDVESAACIEANVCRSGVDCLGDRVCVDGACADGFDCARDGCPDGRVCVNAECILPPDGTCQNNDQCPFGQICNVDTCEPCSADEQCPGNQVCVEGPEGPVCGEPLACVNDDDCVGLRTCVENECVAAICDDGDDAFEPNNALATPQVLMGAQSWPDLLSCDPDWYQIDVPADAQLTVSIRQADAAGDLDLFLVNGDGRTLGSSETLQLLESVTVGPFEGGAVTSVYVEVRPEELVNPVRYTLEVEIIEGGDVCIDDAGEDGVGDDTVETAQVLRAEGEQEVDGLVNGRLCPMDDDYYSIHLTAGERFAIDAEIDINDLTLEVTLIPPVGPEQTTRYGRGIVPEPIDIFPINATGEYILRARAVDGAGDYRLVITAIDADLQRICDDARDALPISLAGGVGQVIDRLPAPVAGQPQGNNELNVMTATCAPPGEGSEAVYVINVDQPQLLMARVTGLGTGTLGDPLVSVRSVCEQAASELACNDDVPSPLFPMLYSINPAELRVPLDRAGQYYVIVEGVDGGDQRDFQLDLESRQLGAAPPNDSCLEAENLVFMDGEASTTVLLDQAEDDHEGSCIGIGGPDAVYRLNLEQPASVRVSLDADFAVGAWISPVCGDAEIEAACGVGLDVALLPAGEYFLGIEGASATSRGRVRVQVQVDEARTDQLNETCDGALALDPAGGEINGDTRAAEDDHRLGEDNVCTGHDTRGGDLAYALSVPNGERVRVEVNPIGGWDASLYVTSACGDLLGNCIAGSDGALSERVVITANGAEGGSSDFNIIVDGTQGERGPFTLSWGPVECLADNECPAGRCVDDRCVND
ncbi:MAG: hypothetical protein ACE366_25325 [Bradymonadia bacterium]